MRLKMLIAFAALVTGGMATASAQTFTPTITIYGAPNSGSATVGGIATNGAVYQYKYMTMSVSYKTYSFDENGNLVTTVTVFYVSGIQGANPFTHTCDSLVTGRKYDVAMTAHFVANRQSNPPYLDLNTSSSFTAP